MASLERNTNDLVCRVVQSHGFWPQGTEMWRLVPTVLSHVALGHITWYPMHVSPFTKWRWWEGGQDTLDGPFQLRKSHRSIWVYWYHLFHFRSENPEPNTRSLDPQIFSIFPGLGNHHCNQCNNIFISPKRNLLLISNHSPSLPRPSYPRQPLIYQYVLYL